MQLYESKIHKGQLMLCADGEPEDKTERNLKKQSKWWLTAIQKIQMERLANGVALLPMEKYFSNNGKNTMYFLANKIANKAVRLQFGVSKPIKKKDMDDEMLKFRAYIMDRIIAYMLAKYRGEIQHIAPLIYDNIVMRVVETKPNKDTKKQKELIEKSE